MNWDWEGSWNGWFAAEYWTPDDRNYSVDRKMMVNIYPD